MGEELPTAKTTEGYGSAEDLGEGVFQVGRHHVPTLAEYGVTLSGEDKDHGEDVTFSLSPREALLLADLIDQNREELTKGLGHESAVASVNGGNAVQISRGDGPEPIPANRSVLK